MVRALISVMLVFALAAAAGQPRALRVERPAEWLPDMGQVRENTRRLEEARRRARAPRVSAEASERVAALLEEAREAVGEAPTAWRRLTSCVWLSEEEKQRLARAKERAEEARAALEEGLEEARFHLEAEEARLRNAAGREVPLERHSAARSRLAAHGE